MHAQVTNNIFTGYSISVNLIFNICIFKTNIQNKRFWNRYRIDIDNCHSAAHISSAFKLNCKELTSHN